MLTFPFQSLLNWGILFLNHDMEQPQQSTLDQMQRLNTLYSQRNIEIWFRVVPSHLSGKKYWTLVLFSPEKSKSNANIFIGMKTLKLGSLNSNGLWPSNGNRERRRKKNPKEWNLEQISASYELYLEGKINHERDWDFRKWGNKIVQDLS